MLVFKISLFTGLLISVLNAYAFNSGYPKPQIYQIKSIFPQRVAFDVYNYQAKKSKGTIVYIYGGGCVFPGTDEMLDLYDFGKKIIESGYSVYIPHYRQSLKWDTGNIPHDEFQPTCKEATLNEIADIKSSIDFLYNELGQKNIFVWGHSFGGFIANTMSLQKPKISNINGYISSNGWWTVTIEWSLWYLSPTSMSPTLQNPSSLSKILIVHTEDDERIPIAQIDYFKNWISQVKNKPNYKLVLYPKGGHSYIMNYDYPSGSFLNEILDFIKQ